MKLIVFTLAVLILFVVSDSSEFISSQEIDLRQTVFGGPLDTRTSSLCQLQLIYIKDNHGSNKKIFPMVDSWGKVPSGILFGHLFAVGNYDQCVEVNVDLPKIFGKLKGKYCKALKKTSESRPVQIGSGVCIPQSCDPEVIDGLLALEFGEETFVLQDCSTNDKPDLVVADIVCITILTMIGFMMIMGTAYDYLSSGDSRNRILMAFSVPSNAGKLFKISSKKSENNIDCINGIRVLSIIWIIFGHTYFYALRVPLINTFTLIPWIRSFYSLFVQNGVIAVDTFFFLSGLLVTWIGIKELEKCQKLNVPLMYLHRYIRLTPLVAFAMLFLVSILKFFGSGPFWSTFVDGMSSTCEKYWWRNILYIQNYFEITEMCLGHSWYLAVDFQLFLLSPIFLFGLFKYGRKFAFGIVFLIALCVGCIYGTFYTKGFKGAMITSDKEIAVRQNTIYLYTHTRCPIWFVGMLFGYFLHKTRYTQRRMNFYIRTLGWATAISILFSIVVGPYYSTQPGSSPTTFVGATYESLGKIAWGLMLSWVIYNCYHGKGGIINHFLSHPLWQPFARLSYSMYICNMAVMTINMGNSHVENHFSNFETILKFWSNFGITLLTAVVLVLAFESPVIGLEKVLFRKSNEENAKPSYETKA
ncbi:hypothetical protein ACFFRR_003581 [Megaselia abdita]